MQKPRGFKGSKAESGGSREPRRKANGLEVYPGPKKQESACHGDQKRSWDAHPGPDKDRKIRNQTFFFFSSCRARSRLGQSSKRLVVDQLFSRCKRTGEKQKARCLPKAETKQPPKQTQTKNTQQRKTPRNLSETLRFQKDEILGTLSTSSRRHSNSRK